MKILSLATPRPVPNGWGIRALWNVALLLCAFNVVFEPSRAVAAGGTSDVPARIDNIYGGLDHQPTQNEVQERERAAGISLSAGQNRQNTVTLDELYQKLEGQAGY